MSDVTHETLKKWLDETRREIIQTVENAVKNSEQHSAQRCDWISGALDKRVASMESTNKKWNFQLWVIVLGGVIGWIFGFFKGGTP